MTLFVPAHVTQRDGSPCQWSNCWAAVGAWLHNGATGGAASVTPSEFRRQAGGGSGSGGSPGCRSGFEGDIVAGLDALGVKASIVKVTVPDARRLLTTPSRALYGLATDYDAVPALRDCQAGDFDGNHAVGWVPGVSSPQKPLMNPLCRDYSGLSLNVLLDAAVLFGKAHGRGSQVWLVRVRRPEPAAPSPDPTQQALVDALRQQVADRDEWIARARALVADLAALSVPG